ncbi:MAG TPA: alpha/beta hydrolase [Solirubrobacteraceae bacterium]|nr:alpha/beta hydrolase [Solirubrobacteraceae bacterium]
MPAMLVHGNPDSHLLWELVQQHLDGHDGEVIAVDLPGFSEPAPAGFTATKETYVEWLIDQLVPLARRAGPVDLVGHDWGSLMVQRIASVRPDLLRSVAVGGAAVDTQYPWHSIAQVWQTPGEGERYMQQDLTPEVSVPYLIENGMPREYAERNSWLVPGNKDCILALYRSAIEIGKEWQPGVEQIELPSMVIWGRHDPYVEIKWGERLAGRMGAELVVLDCGHWWPFEQPRQTAEALQKLWRSAAA